MFHTRMYQLPPVLGVDKGIFLAVLCTQGHKLNKTCIDRRLISRVSSFFYLLSSGEDRVV